MYTYSRKFPIKIIPHVTELGEINDEIHNYQKPKILNETHKSKSKEMEDENEDENDKNHGKKTSKES